MMNVFEAYQEIIPDFELFQKSLKKPFQSHFRVNRLKIEVNDLVRIFMKKGVRLKRSHKKDDSLYYAPGLASLGTSLEYYAGFIHPQALTSCLAANALSPPKDSCVLDMCASPGGKTSHIAQLMEGTGVIVANELYSNRQSRLGHTLSRLGVLNVMVTEYQAQEFPLKQHFDFVLADVPCSGEGMFRNPRESDAYNERSTKARLPDLQKKILLRGFDLLKENGIMLYSTCTYNPKENEAVVNDLLNKRDAILLPLDIGIDYEPGITEWRQERYDGQLKECARFYPHRVDSVGFFMARIGKRR